MRKRLYHLYKGKTQKSLKKEEKMKRYNNLPYIRLFSIVTIFLIKDKSEAFFYNCAIQICSFKYL